jgi:hypothetical protein
MAELGRFRTKPGDTFVITTDQLRLERQDGTQTDLPVHDILCIRLTEDDHILFNHHYGVQLVRHNGSYELVIFKDRSTRDTVATTIQQALWDQSTAAAINDVAQQEDRLPGEAGASRRHRGGRGKPSERQV